MFFGIIRYLLSIFVLFDHLLWSYFNYYGNFAVFCFYILAGYFSILTIEKKYRKNPGYISKYITNRLLRIFPAYFAAFIISILVIKLFPNTSSETNRVLVIPQNAIDWLKNIFIIGLNQFLFFAKPSARLVPTAWFLGNMLILYVIAIFWIKNIKKSLFLVLLGLMVHIVYLAYHAPFSMRYFSLEASILPFSLGSLLYYLGQKNIKITTKENFFILFFSTFLFLVNLIFAKQISDPIYLPFYLNILFFCLITFFLSNLDRSAFSKKMLSADNILGAISYIIFLIHWHVVVIISSFLTGCEPIEKICKIKIFLFSFPLINLSSIIIYLLIDKKIKKLKQ